MSRGQGRAQAEPVHYHCIGIVAQLSSLMIPMQCNQCIKKYEIKRTQGRERTVTQRRGRGEPEQSQLERERSGELLRE